MTLLELFVSLVFCFTYTHVSLNIINLYKIIAKENCKEILFVSIMLFTGDTLSLWIKICDYQIIVFNIADRSFFK